MSSATREQHALPPSARIVTSGDDSFRVFSRRRGLESAIGAHRCTRRDGRQGGRQEARERPFGHRAKRLRVHDVALMNAPVGVRGQVHRVLDVHARLGERSRERATERVEVDGRRGIGLEVERIERIRRELAPASWWAPKTTGLAAMSSPSTDRNKPSRTRPRQQRWRMPRHHRATAEASFASLTFANALSAVPRE